MFIRDFFAYINGSKLTQVSLSIACVTAYFIINKTDIPTLEYKDFKFSFDIIKFSILLIGVYYALYFLLQNLTSFSQRICLKSKILKSIKNLTIKEQAFLYDRLYLHNNEKSFCVKTDNYFYPREYDNPEDQKELYHFESEEDIGFFIRGLEQKGLLREKNDNEMIIPDIVWDTLKENTDIVFKNYGLFHIISKQSK